MRTLVLAFAVFLAGFPVREVRAERTEVLAVRPLRVVYAKGTLEGTCALVDVEPQSTGYALYFITSARLFKAAQGDPQTPAPEVRVMMDDGTRVSVAREHRYFPLGSLIDIAVLRVDVTESRVAPASMAFAVPPPGHAIEIVGFDSDGLRQVVTQRVRFTSTRFVVGDGDLSTLVGCLGAPVIDDNTIVGVVSECERARAPLITPLSVAFPFLTRQIPRLTARPTSRNQP